GVSPGAAASITTLPTLEDGLFFAVALPSAVFLSASWDLPVFRQVAGELSANALVLVPVGAGIALLTWLAVRTTLGGGLGARNQRRGLRVLARLRRRLRATWMDAREVFHLVARRGKSRFALSMLLTAIQWTARYSV